MKNNHSADKGRAMGKGRAPGTCARVSIPKSRFQGCNLYCVPQSRGHYQSFNHQSLNSRIEIYIASPQSRGHNLIFITPGSRPKNPRWNFGNQPHGPQVPKVAPSRTSAQGKRHWARWRSPTRTREEAARSGGMQGQWSLAGSPRTSNVLRCAKRPGLKPARVLGPGSLCPSLPSLALWAHLRACPGALARVGSVSVANILAGALGLNPCPPMGPAQGDASPLHCTLLREFSRLVMWVGAPATRSFCEPIFLESLFRVDPRSSIRGRALPPRLEFRLPTAFSPARSAPRFFSPAGARAWGTGGSAPGSFGGPDPSTRLRPQLGQDWDALSRPRDRRGAQWTSDMESMVEHCIRHLWDTASRQGETHYQWGFRMDAI